MYHPTTRVLTALELLQTHGRMTGAELARRLEVNVRTARRYIEMLQDLGIPVEAERGRYGAYQLRPGYKLPPLMFNEDEAVALTLGLITARRLGLSATAPAIEGTLAKVERVMPRHIRERLIAVEETLVLDVGRGGAAPTNEVLMTLSAATRTSHRVWLCYRSGKEADTERAFDSYGIVYRSGFWYAIGFCHLRQDVRLFRLDRVRTALLRDETFSRPPDFDPLAAVQKGLAMVPGDWAVEVLLETTLETARQIVPPTLAVLEETPDGVLLRCYMDDAEWMARTLARLGLPFVVHHPPELRAALHQHATQIAAYAERL